MSAQTAVNSPEFQVIITQVETALAQAALDASELAERTGTPLVVRDTRQNRHQEFEATLGNGLSDTQASE